MTETTHAHTYTYTTATPFGLIRLTADGEAITGLTWLASGEADKTAPDPVTAQAAKEIAEYAAGTRQQFTVPTSLRHCSPSLQNWLTRLRQVKYGDSISYTSFAKLGGNVKAVRTAGSACARNPIPLIYPCHRVRQKNGALGNFGALRNLPANHAKNLAIKEALLQHEQRHSA